MTQSACKAIEFGEITQNKGYYAVEGHSRSPMSVLIESPYAISDQTKSDIHRTVSKLLQIIVILDENRSLCLFESPPLGLNGNIHCLS